MTAPRVSVLMAAHNAETFIEEAVTSILTQTWEHLELIVVNDGSTDLTSRLLAALCASDRRLRLLTNDRNLGLAASLNRAIAAASGDFLARMDADDIALPQRLQRQLEVFESVPDLVLLGSNVSHISPTGTLLGCSELPLDDWTIRCVNLSLNAFAHPTVMMRADPFRTDGLHYDTSFETTQDWDLWIRLMQYGRVGNLKQTLVKQRIHTASMSVRKRQVQLEYSLRIQQTYSQRFLNSTPWNREHFKLMNEAFYGDRRSADSSGHDLVAACRIALALLAAVERQYPQADGKGYRRFVVKRCLRMGLMPPTRRGAVGLAVSLVLRHPGATIDAFAKLIGKRFQTVLMKK